MNPTPDPSPPGGLRTAAVIFALVVGGWLLFAGTVMYANRLSDAYGPCPDVVDALGRDCYIGRRTWPFFTAVLVLDAVAGLVALYHPVRWGWPLVIKVLAVGLLFPGVLWHGLVWAVSSFFAAV